MPMSSSGKGDGDGTGAPDDEKASSRTTTSKPRRPLRLTDSQRERKRAIDREAQRNIRNKTKNYIAYLEDLVKATQVGDGSESTPEDRTKWLLNQLQQSQDETRRLREMVSGVQKLLGGDNGGDLSLASATLPSSVLSGMASANIAPSICTALDNDLDENRDSSESIVSPHATDLVTSHGQPPPESEQAFPYVNVDGALFYFAREQLVLALVDGARPGSTQAEDDDITIRAVLHGWSSVEDMYALDVGWRALKQIDQVIFSCCGVVERIVILRSMRRTWLHQLREPELRLLARAPYMDLEISQTGRTPAVPQIIDHFAWPGLREAFYQAPHRYVTTNFAQAFQTNFRFIWPFEVADAYTKDPVSTRYACSPEFATRQADLNCWTMRGDFFSGRRELYTAIRQFDGSIGRTLMPHNQLMIQAAPSNHASGRSASNPSVMSHADNEPTQKTEPDETYVSLSMMPTMMAAHDPSMTWINGSMQENVNRLWPENVAMQATQLPQTRNSRGATMTYIT